ncbi:amino acid--tRNA ligase-related protein, partial [Staphylococcus epidermidis]|uniref:amino acid--tRNA ligase-related protein n=1 Tax=Staphylococcus epidermidis TaxID=1282 RepID=UPI0028CB2CE8
GGLGDKFDGLEDIEERYGEGYLDLIRNEDSRQRFINGSKIIEEMRKYLNKEGLLEVERGMMEEIAGGGGGGAFVTD